MKKQKLFILFSLTVLCLSGCSKTEKDNSFDTDLYGTYSNNIEASNIDYQLKVSHTFNKDNTYHGKYFEKSNGEILDDSEKEAKIIATENINNDIEKMIFINIKICSEDFMRQMFRVVKHSIYF